MNCESNNNLKLKYNILQYGKKEKYYTEWI